MKIQVLLTGSDGNCSLIKSKNTTILIDGGFKAKYKMEEIINPILMENKIDGIIITHEHTDHLNSWTGRLSIMYDIPIYLHKKHYENEENRKTKYFTYDDKRSGLGEKRAELIFIEENKEFIINDLKIYPFAVYHDAKKTLGYRFNDNELTYVTDCGFISNKIKKELLKSENIALEFNYDKNLIVNSERNWENKFRTLGKFGHLGNSEAVDFLILAKEKYNKIFKNIITLHSSQLHNTKEILSNEIQKLLDKDINSNFFISERENNNIIDL